MLIRQKAGWRLHHQAYLWPRRYKSSSSLSSSPSSSMVVAAISSCSSVASPVSATINKRKKPTATDSRSTKLKSSGNLKLSPAKQQRRRTNPESETTRRRQFRAHRATLVGNLSAARRIDSNGSDGVPSPTSSSSSSSPSSLSAKKPARGHLDLPWFLGTRSSLLKPWEEPYLDSSDDEGVDETIAVRLRRHTRRKHANSTCSTKRSSSGANGADNEVVVMTTASTSLSASPQPSTSVVVIVPGKTAAAVEVGSVPSELGVADQDNKGLSVNGPTESSHGVIYPADQTLASRPYCGGPCTRTRRDSRVKELRSDASCSEKAVNSDNHHLQHSFGYGEDKGLSNNVVIVINNNHNIGRNNNDSSECGVPSKSCCEHRADGLTPRAHRGMMGVLCNESKQPCGGLCICNTSAYSPPPATLPSLPPSPESLVSADSNEGPPSTSESVSAIKCLSLKSKGFRDSIISCAEHVDEQCRTKDVGYGDELSEHVKEEIQNYTLEYRRSTRAQQRLASSHNGADSNGSTVSVSMTSDTSGNIMVHPSVTVTVFSSGSLGSANAPQIMQVPSCKDAHAYNSGSCRLRDGHRFTGCGAAARTSSLDNIPSPRRNGTICHRGSCQPQEVHTMADDIYNICRRDSVGDQCTQPCHDQCQFKSQCSQYSNNFCRPITPAEDVLSSSLSTPSSSPSPPCCGDAPFCVSLSHNSSNRHGSDFTSPVTSDVGLLGGPVNVSENCTTHISCRQTFPPSPDQRQHLSSQGYRRFQSSASGSASIEQCSSNSICNGHYNEGDDHKPSNSNISSPSTLSSTTSAAPLILPPAESTSKETCINITHINGHIMTAGSVISAGCTSGLGLSSHVSKETTIACKTKAFRPNATSIVNVTKHTPIPEPLSASSSTNRASCPSPSIPNTVVECKWRGCTTPHGLDPSNLLEHIRQHAEEQIARESYACLWSDCKVYNRPSWSGSWLERHIVTHSGHRPFKCILDNCGQRFHSQAALERHVNSHFGSGSNNHGVAVLGSGSGCQMSGSSGTFNGASSSGSGSRVGGSRSREQASHHRMALKRKRLLKRRHIQTVRKNDIFDEQTMNVVRQDLTALTTRSGLDLSPGVRGPLQVSFSRQVISRRTCKSGTKQLLLEYSPSEVVESTWVTEQDMAQENYKVISTLTNSSSNSEKSVESSILISDNDNLETKIPVYALPFDSVSGLHPSLYRRHRFRANKRK